jgi:hypothetical protein
VTKKAVFGGLEVAVVHRIGVDRLRVIELQGVEGKVDAMHVLSELDVPIEQHEKVDVAILAGIPSRHRSEEHDALEALAIDRAQPGLDRTEELVSPGVVHVL